MGRDWQVLDGLKSGDRMVVEGLLRVKADMKVSPRPPAWK
jgi:multidrug efflux pump subunit AcrA (membrane-fusion protein)